MNRRAVAEDKPAAALFHATEKGVYMNKKKTGMICTGLILLGILTGLGIFFLKWNRHRILTENLELAEQFSSGRRL